VHAPIALGGLLMIVGAQLLRRGVGRGGRIVATVGAAVVVGVGSFLSVIWISLDQPVIGSAGLFYAPLHGVAIALVWHRTA
jgi:hypothetical protein